MKTPKKPAPPALLLRCGCEVPFKEKELPICKTHGKQVIVRVLRMPPPRIRGVARGPHVQTQDLPAWTGRLTGSDRNAESTDAQ